MFKWSDYKELLRLRRQGAGYDYHRFKENHPAELAYYAASKWKDSPKPIKRILGEIACTKIAGGKNEKGVLQELSRMYIENVTADMDYGNNIFLVQVRTASGGVRCAIKTGQEVIELLGISNEQPDNIKIYRLDCYGAIPEVKSFRGYYDEFNEHSLFQPGSSEKLVSGFSSLD